MKTTNNQSSNNNRRIAKNMLFLYFRMFFIMAVNLYTSRIVLKTLGVEDFGIYNVVGGIITMFAFINSAMATTTQRYLTFELGRNDRVGLKTVFSASVTIHFIIAAIILLLGETVGLWFLYHKMVIPESRMQAALWVYQLSILATIVMIVSVPYNACIIAHEKMSAFAYISILEVLLKLGIVYVLWLVDWDKLKLYAVLMFATQLLIRLVYGRYCGKHFGETKLQLVKDKKLIKEMLSFAGWNLWGNCASVFSTQGLNILLNMFFGPTVNAARGIAVQLQAAIMQFSVSFQTAVNPQITKAYAGHDMSYMHKLIYGASKYSCFLLILLSFPIMLNMPFLLRVWLSEYPAYTVSFARLMICCTIVDAVANPLMVSASATGKVRKYQSTLGCLMLCILPVSYVVLKLGGNAISVFVVNLIICIIAFVTRLLIIRPMIGLSFRTYFKEVVVRIFLVIIVVMWIPFLMKCNMSDDWKTCILTSIVSIAVLMPAMYYLGLDKTERLFLKEKVVLKLKN